MIPKVVVNHVLDGPYMWDAVKYWSPWFLFYCTWHVYL